ncbi:MAG: shikimate kinase [Actinomycetota bacterium]
MTLVGYMGSGKTTVGRLLARRLGRGFVDLDREVERSAGMTIPEIFERFGEGCFRDLEHATLLKVLSRGHDTVVACGGGVILRAENRQALSRTQTVFLREDLDVLYRRTRRPGRPLRAATKEEFARRYADREPLYERVADLTVEVDGRTTEEVAEEVVRWLHA